MIYLHKLETHKPHSATFSSTHFSYTVQTHPFSPDTHPQNGEHSQHRVCPSLSECCWLKVLCIEEEDKRSVHSNTWLLLPKH